MSDKLAIEVKDLKIRYRTLNKVSIKKSIFQLKKSNVEIFEAVRGVSFNVNEGEIVGITGKNGSGKSTMLRAIAGIFSADEGSIDLHGHTVSLLAIGVGFQKKLTGRENIYLAGMLLGFSEREINKHMKEIIKFSELGDFIDKPVKTYSSGMFVRLAFAVAINIDPEILIVDEALSVGDVFFQSKCYHKFEEFKKMGKTILFVSHDLGSITKYCDRAILLNKGHKLFEGTPKEAVDMYKRVLVNQLEDGEDGKMVWDQGVDKKLWRSALPINPEVLEYGSKKAEIVDFAFVDANGRYSNVIEKGSEMTVKMKALFHEDIAEPIFAFSFKNLLGIELCGTNTMFEKVEITPKKAGETQTVSFKQKMDLQGGEYLLSLGCTGYPHGEFTVYHRLYDVCSLTVVSTKNTVGYYDMNTEITVE